MPHAQKTHQEELSTDRESNTGFPATSLSAILIISYHLENTPRSQTHYFCYSYFDQTNLNHKIWSKLSSGQIILSVNVFNWTESRITQEMDSWACLWEIISVALIRWKVQPVLGGLSSWLRSWTAEKEKGLWAAGSLPDCGSQVRWASASSYCCLGLPHHDRPNSWTVSHGKAFLSSGVFAKWVFYNQEKKLKTLFPTPHSHMDASVSSRWVPTAETQFEEFEHPFQMLQTPRSPSSLQPWCIYSFLQRTQPVDGA